MNPIQINECIRKSILEMLQDSQSIYINPDTHLQKDIGFNSLAMVELLLKLEETFLIRFDDEDLNLEKISTIEGLTNIVRTKLAMEE